MTLLKAEAGFCPLKGTLGLRPNFHQLEDRVDGHIFISVLGTHSLGTTRLPLVDGRTINIRKPSQPDDELKRVYQMLGIDWKAAFPNRKTEIPA